MKMSHTIQNLCFSSEWATAREHWTSNILMVDYWQNPRFLPNQSRNHRVSHRKEGFWIVLCKLLPWLVSWQCLAEIRARRWDYKKQSVHNAAHFCAECIWDNKKMVDWQAGTAQYFTLLHEFRRIPLESHGMLEFHWESAGMVGMCHSCGFLWIPSGIPGKFHGNSTQIPEWFQVEFEWNSHEFQVHSV